MPDRQSSRRRGLSPVLFLGRLPSCGSAPAFHHRFRAPLLRFGRAKGPSPRILVYLEFEELTGELDRMTQMDVSYRYANRPDESTMRAIDNLREVYGIRRISFNEKEQIVRVEYDASRLREPTVASLLRKAGLAIGEKLVLA